MYTLCFTKTKWVQSHRDREQKLAPQKLPSQKFSSHLPEREDARKISAIVSNNTDAYRHLALCGCLVTTATHMLAETVYGCFGDLAPVSEANGAHFILWSSFRLGFRSAEHSAHG